MMPNTTPLRFPRPPLGADGFPADGESDAPSLRWLLWLRHGCPHAALYGDDGEMQCTRCGIDFKRDHVLAIGERFYQQGEARMRAAAEGSG